MSFTLCGYNELHQLYNYIPGVVQGPLDVTPIIEIWWLVFYSFQHWPTLAFVGLAYQGKDIVFRFIYQV
jgi:hypothetical protein